MFTKSMFVMLGILTLTTMASAAVYRPLVRCEGGSVVLDEVLQSPTQRLGFQIVVHGGLVPGVAREIPGMLHNGNRTFVRALPDGRFFVGNRPNDGVFRQTSAVLIGSDLEVFVTFSNVDGGRRSGNWIFRGCQPVR